MKCAAAAGVCAVLKSWVDCCFWLLSCHADLSDTGWRGQALTFPHYVIWIQELSPYFSWCNLYAGRNSPEGGQLKNQQPSESPSSASAQKRAFSSCCGTKGMCGNASQRHSFISWLAKHPQRYMDINVYSFSHMLGEYELHKKCGMTFLCAFNCINCSV